MEIATEFHRIADDAPPYVIAEIGLNHNGDLALAKRMVAAAAAAGASAAKFQWYAVEHFLAPEASFGDDGPGSLRRFFAGSCLEQAEWSELARFCREHGIDFGCSVFDLPSLEAYVALRPAWIKIASGDLDNRQLIEAAAARAPVILSTGMGTEGEVERAARWLQNGKRPHALLQCVSQYPARPESYNLRVLPAWRERHGTLVGISDHCAGNEISFGAVALGACIVERHFTLDRGLAGPDQALSLEPDDLRALVEGSRRIQASLGTGVKTCLPEEEPVRTAARRSLRAARSLEAGTRLEPGDIALLRPSAGLAAHQLNEVLGRTLSVGKHPGQALHLGDLTGLPPGAEPPGGGATNDAASGGTAAAAEAEANH